MKLHVQEFFHFVSFVQFANWLKFKKKVLLKNLMIDGSIELWE